MVESLCKNKYAGDSYSLSDSFWGRPAPISGIVGWAGPTTLCPTTPSVPRYDRGAGFCRDQCHEKLARQKSLVESVYVGKNMS